MSSTADLLRRCAWQAEKLLKQRGHFRGVLWLTERADGKLELTEERCDDAPNAATDDEVLTMLAADVAADFAYDGVVRFAVAYAGTATTFMTTLAREPTTKRCEVVAIEAHNADTHVRAWREIIRQPGRAPMLGALSAIEPAADSRYARLLACETVMMAAE
jgi:hypothetical protein